ncbi:g995 [Coccomyxa viridis]|uniref:G995 protein n=1 Tax=Coccomyxa viridis TaxID=1274662 RepID=A0ABP1FGZ9_9CHLO
MTSGKKEGGNFNPFRNKKKEDAAKKALEEMFGGQQDVLAAYDAGGGNSGKGGGRRGGGGGGGDSEGGSFDFRQWLANLFQGLGKTGRSLGKTVAAILLLLSIFYASNFIKPLMRATINGLRWVLRLDGAGSRRTRRQPAPVPADSQATLGEHERSILAKYAQDDDEDQEEQQHSPSGEQDDDNDPE